jgi:hypothetical protein
MQTKKYSNPLKNILLETVQEIFNLSKKESNYTFETIKWVSPPIRIGKTFVPPFSTNKSRSNNPFNPIKHLHNIRVV